MTATYDDPLVPSAALSALKRKWTPGPDYAREPVLWSETRQPGVHLWSKQREVLTALTEHNNVAVKSCHSAGKSFISAQAVCWWLDSHDPGEAFVVTSAPTGDQVKAILWREVHKTVKRTGLPGKLNLSEWYVDGELVALGRKPNEYEPTAFQGIHARYILVVLDEACGIPEQLWEAASTLASNVHGRILAIGNPDDPTSHFATVCKSEFWHVITISAFDTPNFTGEPVPEDLAEVITSRRWVEQKRSEWTEQSPLWHSKVLGLFPEDAEDGVVPVSWATQCRYLSLAPTGERELGLDVSAGGTDSTYVWLRDGPVAVRKWRKSGEKDPLALAQWVLQIILDVEPDAVKVDSIGVGWGVGGILDGWWYEGKHDCSVVPVNVSTQADDHEHFLNTRAELWWQARERSRLKEWDLRALDDDDVNELTVPKYHTRNPRSRIQVEGKDDIRKRLKRSPDSADALLLAFADADTDAVIHTEHLEGSSSSSR